MRNSIRWRLALSFATIALLAALALGAILGAILVRSYAEREAAYLAGNAAAISSMLTQANAAGAPAAAVKQQIEGLAFLAQVRVRWLDAAGATLLDTGTPKQASLAFGDPLGGMMVTGSFTTTESLPNGFTPISAVGSPGGFQLGVGVDLNQITPRAGRLVQMPLHDASGALTGHIELSEGPAYGRDVLTNVGRGWLVAALLAVSLASLAGWLVSGRITAPIHALAQTAGRMADGDLAARVPAGGNDELGRMGRAFNRMADQVEADIVALRQFVADAAHQMHTPLTALRTNLELATDRAEDAAPNVYLARAQGQVARLTTLTDELLQLARVETGLAGAAAQRFDLVSLVRSLAEAQAARAEQTEIAFNLDVPATPVWLNGQPEQISGLADNLVDNALKFTPAGGAVAVQLAVEEGFARLSVEDTGIGIPEDELPQLFSRFHRGRNAAAYPGSGLGLAYVKAVAERHGGRVAAENTATGARFTVTLPVVESVV